MPHHAITHSMCPFRHQRPPRQQVESLLKHRQAVGVDEVLTIAAKAVPEETLIGTVHGAPGGADGRSEEHTSELQSLMRISYAVFCLQKTIHLETVRANAGTSHTHNNQLCER